MKRLVVFVTILLLACVTVLSGAGPDTQWLGVLWTKGSVSVGNAKVSSGTTVLPGDVITTAAGASAWLRFRSPASTTLLADTQVALLASNSAPSLMLRSGTVVVDEKVVDPVQVAVPGGYVLVKGDPQNGALCELAALDNGAMVSVKRGSAEVHSAFNSMTLQAGQSARLEAAPQGGGQVAGKIDRELPSGTIQRVGQTEELPLRLNEVIDWNDLIRTLDAGRAQITLLDGSLLNVGARSVIKIVKHDPQAQQTEIEMTLGKMQAQVQKITTPGGKFELTTKSAVIGTIDTSYVAETDGNRTRVCGVEGSTLVKSSDPNITKTVTLHKNECTVVVLGGAPSDPVFSPGEVASLLNATSLPGAATLGGATTTTAAAGGLSHGTLIWIAAGSAAAAGGIIAGVVLSGGTPTSRTTP